VRCQIKWFRRRLASTSSAALQCRETMFRKSQRLMSGFEWVIILFVAVIPFRAAEVVAEALGYSHLIALACGMVVMAIFVLGYFAIRPMMLPD
jgi:predicted Na+-dependent transporter